MIILDANWFRDYLDNDTTYSDRVLNIITDQPDEKLEAYFEIYLRSAFWHAVDVAFHQAIRDICDTM